MASTARRGDAKNQLRLGRLEPGDDLVEVGLIRLRGGFRLLRPAIPVPQAEVEVDQIPVSLSEPSVDMLNPKSGIAAIAFDAVHICFAGKELPNACGVASRDRVTDDQYPWQRGIVYWIGERI